MGAVQHIGMPFCKPGRMQQCMHVMQQMMWVAPCAGWGLLAAVPFTAVGITALALTWGTHHLQLKGPDTACMTCCCADNPDWPQAV